MITKQIIHKRTETKRQSDKIINKKTNIRKMQKVNGQEKVESGNGLLTATATNGNGNGTNHNGNGVKLTKNDKSFSSMSDRSISPTFTISEQ